MKLANALETSLDPSGRRALDVGASTGGFTDCLLQRGAAARAALDVAYGELHWRLRQDPRVTVIERRNARSLEPGELPYRPDLIVADVSFISLAKVLPGRAGCGRSGVRLPGARQAPVRGRPRAGRARAAWFAFRRARRETLVEVGPLGARRPGAACWATPRRVSPGPAGNRESFVWLAEPGRAGSVEDLEAAARRAEP